jgi:hypothetical protein
MQIGLQLRLRAAFLLEEDMAKKNAPAKAQDAEMAPTALLELNGKTFQLCFTFGALREAKLALRGRGIDINILNVYLMGRIDADTLPELFYASLRRHHSDISFDDAMAMIDRSNFLPIVNALIEAWRISTHDPGSEESKTSPLKESQA